MKQSIQEEIKWYSYEINSYEINNYEINSYEIYSYKIYGYKINSYKEAHPMEKKSVFISYSSKDAEEVKAVIDVLESAGISYWKAPEMIPIGSNYAKEIPRVISECTVFLLIISKASQNSIWVEKEIDFAINNRKTIVPLKITDEPLSDIFTFYLNNVQTIFYMENKSKALRLLKERILALIDGKKEFNNNEMNRYEAESEKEKTGIRRGRRLGHLDESFGMNPQPVICKYCNGKLKMISKGIYECLNCHKENYDYFQTVRNYLNQGGPSSKFAIEKATGVPRESIDYFIKQEQLKVLDMNNSERDEVHGEKYLGIRRR